VAHALERLTSRTSSAAAADRGFALLRDREALSAFLAQRAAASEAFAGAEKIAFALDDGDRPAHLLVARDGGGVTCLGPGMGFAAPVVTFAETRAFLDERARLVRAQVALQRAAQENEASSPLMRAVHYAYRLTRSEYDMLVAVSPLAVGLWMEMVQVVVERIVDLRERRQWVHDDEQAQALWRIYTAACHAVMLGAAHDEMFFHTVLAAMTGDSLLAGRALWVLVNHPQRTLRLADEVTTSTTVAATFGATVLPMIALRFPAYRKDAAQLARKLAPRGDESPDVAGAYVLGMEEDRGEIEKVLVVLVATLFRAQLGEDERVRLNDDTAARIARVNAVSGGVAKADAFDPVVGALWRQWRPLDDLGAPARTAPRSPPALENDDAERRRIEHCRRALDGCILPVGGRGPTALQAMAAAMPIEALLPGTEPDPVWRLSTGADYVRNELRVMVTGGDEHKPTRNGPCSCGSGKKYKKCCGRARAL
jgi:hypothetical protein